jgi:hypothetical protein
MSRCTTFFLAMNCSPRASWYAISRDYPSLSGPRLLTMSSKLPSGQNSSIMVTLCSVRKQSKMRVVKR